MSALSACPLCRTVLTAEASPQGALLCPSCGADLTAFVNLETRAAQYLALCRDLLSRGDTEAARAIIQQLPLLTELDPHDLAEISCRLALQDGDLPGAATQLALCSPLTAAQLTDELELRTKLYMTAQELYNYALSAAKTGEYTIAAEQLLLAVKYAPREATIWCLKLKTDLKCGYYLRCYEDLRALDRLHARPEQFAFIDQLLPAIA